MKPPHGSSQVIELEPPEADGTAIGDGHTVGRAALEARVRQLAARVAELEREKTDIEAYAAEAAHELVEPLVLIEALAAAAGQSLDAGEADRAGEDLDTIRLTAARLRRLAETLLHSASSAGRTVVMRSVDCNVLVGEVVELLRPEIERRRATVEVRQLPMVHGEPTLLCALFTNLLGNALKYGPRSGGVITVTALQGPAEWEISVADAGPVIPAYERARIFEPFRRGRFERRSRGAGLGLATCRKIVERHGGRIGVTATRAGGNRFYFTMSV